MNLINYLYEWILFWYSIIPKGNNFYFSYLWGFGEFVSRWPSWMDLACNWRTGLSSCMCFVWELAMELHLSLCVRAQLLSQAAAGPLSSSQREFDRRSQDHLPHCCLMHIPCFVLWLLIFGPNYAEKLQQYFVDLLSFMTSGPLYYSCWRHFVSPDHWPYSFS